MVIADATLVSCITKSHVRLRESTGVCSVVIRKNTGTTRETGGGGGGKHNRGRKQFNGKHSRPRDNDPLLRSPLSGCWDN
ncbi:unnamed protein product [Ilex paraguariensis]|uniref:Uncharacterized protein n=1 Tax=Ilex paraguariensis TaxID=185542 RepID=A0ABC8T7P4_9AQUA